jgi:hypothetical protein
VTDRSPRTPPAAIRVYFHPHGKIGHLAGAKGILCGRHGDVSPTPQVAFNRKTDCQQCAHKMNGADHE